MAGKKLWVLMLQLAIYLSQNLFDQIHFRTH